LSILPGKLYPSVSHFFGLRHPTAGEYNLLHPVAKPIAICFEVCGHFENSIFEDILKNAVARGTPVGKNCSTLITNLYFHPGSHFAILNFKQQ